MPTPPLEFHLSRLARERYHFDGDLLKWEGEFAQPDVPAVHELVFRMNARAGGQGRGVRPGHLYALVLIQHILHLVVDRYRRQRETRVLELAEDWLATHVSAAESEHVKIEFGGHYAPPTVFRGEQTLDGYANSAHGDVLGRHLQIEQVLLVYLSNANPAAGALRDLYDDRELLARERYLQLVKALQEFLATMPTYGPGGKSLFDLLAEPARMAPDSLLKQLEFIRTEWAEMLGSDVLKALLKAQDFVREDEKNLWGAFTPSQTPDMEYLKALASKAMFAGAYAEPERFSPDMDWMPRVVLLAKSVYVWLDQLSKKYGRHIRQLDEVPDEELDVLSSWGFTGLWLIGLWERSEASRAIKNIRGNTDAVASAYSLYDYRISGDLGGDAALENLKTRALARGIRLASDMVPNHMGIDSKWTREHPDWFIQMSHPPYSAYNFNGPNLSQEPNIDIRIEDGYWSQTDAAVVFRRVDHRTGETRYLYHGNDGTSMPWNDTAQLDFLNPAVREAVIQLVLHVARQFPIMRFDAAMTLTKMHYQRLWFPEPGTGGAIPSRALFGMTRHEFDERMPQEFWREVVDRVAAEAPDTLLLAEAFWLLEGYFVRTLGMHRVYNSAFMNMLKLEENAKYRSVIKNVLEFDPRVLPRFVNFMNNPDEDTAIAQFGKGDKYFGVCLMLATMPGLPMFGHGQIEGLTEKYGHEFQRAYYDEQPDEDLVRRHEREIFPVLRQRYLFSGVEHFVLYDVYGEGGRVDENVYAYSNGYGDARALIVYHNRYAETAGWIHTSAAFSVADGAGGRKLVRKTLAEALGLKNDPSTFYILRDRITGLEYLRRASNLAAQGLFVHLHAYQYQVFTEFREVQEDEEGRWSRLSDKLNGRGVPSVDREFKRIYFAPLIEAFEDFTTADNFKRLIETAARSRDTDIPVSPLETTGLRRDLAAAARSFAAAAHHFIERARLADGGLRETDEVVRDLETLTALIFELQVPGKLIDFDDSTEHHFVRDHLVRAVPEKISATQSFWQVLCGFTAARSVDLLDDSMAIGKARARLDDWLLGEVLGEVFQRLGEKADEAWHEVDVIRALLSYRDIAESFDEVRRFGGLLKSLDDPVINRLAGCHAHGGTVWFHRESFEALLRWLFVGTALDAAFDEGLTPCERAEKLGQAARHFNQIDDLAAVADYQWERFKVLLSYAA
jgi:glycosidase